MGVMITNNQVAIDRSKLRVNVFGRKRTATAVAQAQKGQGLIKVNGVPLHLVEPAPLRTKLFEPILVLGKEEFENIDIRITVRGGGQTAQIYAIRQAMARAIVAYHHKYTCEMTKIQLKSKLQDYDRSLIVSDPRRCEVKLYGGPGARARYQKSYR